MTGRERGTADVERAEVMGGLTRQDRRRLADLGAALDRWDGPLSIEELLGELLDIEHPFSYGLEVAEGRLRVAFAHGHLAGHVRDEMERALRRGPRRWFGYDPYTPAPGARNRAYVVCPTWAAQFGISHMLRDVGYGAHYHLRVLVCDGPQLLAWIGGLQVERPSRRQNALLNALVPALNRRLVLDRRVASEGLLRGALDAALEQLGGAAFLLGPRGRLEHANAAGWQRLARESGALVARLHAAAAGAPDPDLEVQPIALPGQHGHLVIERPPDRSREQARAAAARWRLTPRQTQVLERVAAGHTNARVGVELGIAPGTVELHVTAILARAAVPSRAALIAAVFAAP